MLRPASPPPVDPQGQSLLVGPIAERSTALGGPEALRARARARQSPVTTTDNRQPAITELEQTTERRRPHAPRERTLDQDQGQDKDDKGQEAQSIMKNEGPGSGQKQGRRGFAIRLRVIMGTLTLVATPSLEE